jgi:hypothetical protein
MPDQFEAGIAIDQDDQFAAERQKRKVRMWAKTALAGQTDTSQRCVFETRGDLRPGGVELGAGPLNIATEGPETVGVDAHGQANNEAKALVQDGPNDLLFAVHGRQHGGLVAIGAVMRFGHQK